MIKKVNIAEIKQNEENPRFIKDKKFKKLVKSIKKFPKMLEVRRLVVDENMIVLGGNMRLRALKSAGIFEVPIDQVFDWSEEEKREFIIKDNLSFGEWDWDILANEWNNELLGEWGMDIPYTEDDVEEMQNPMNEQSEKPFATELDSQSNYLILKFNTDIDWLQAKTLFGLKTETGRRANGKAWSMGIGRVLNGVDAINKIQNES